MPGVGPQPDAGLAGRAGLLDELERGGRLRQRQRVVRGRDHVEVLDAVGHPPRRPGQLAPARTPGARAAPRPAGRPIASARSSTTCVCGARRRRPPSRAARMLSSALGPNPLSVRMRCSCGRGAQRLQRIDPQLLEQPPGALGPEAGEARHLDQPGRELRAQLDQRGNLARRRPARCTFSWMIAPIPGSSVARPCAGQRGHRDRRVAHRLGRVAVGDDPVDDRPVELVQVAELVERRGDLGVRRIGDAAADLCGISHRVWMRLHQLVRSTPATALYFLK